MKRIKFALEFLLTLALIAGLVWAINERMEMRAESLEIAEEIARPRPGTSQTSTVVINPDGTTAGRPYLPGATDSITSDGPNVGDGDDGSATDDGGDDESETGIGNGGENESDGSQAEVENPPGEQRAI